MKKAEYMGQHIGEVFTGVISSVLTFGFFVELPNTVEGLVHVSSLVDDYYTFGRRKWCCSGSIPRKCTVLGTR